MLRLAHVSDLHLVEPHWQTRTAAQRVRLNYLSFGRPIDAEGRRERAIERLRQSRLEADHVVVTGDLTEDGLREQFEVLAEVIHEAGISPERISLIPGNHDAYDRLEAYEDALDGPLGAYVATSKKGAVTLLDEAILVSVSNLIDQPYTRSAGRSCRDDLETLAKAARDGAGGRTVVAIQHHPPLAHALSVVNWVDGLLNHRENRGLLEECRNVHVLHGHVHRATNRRIKSGEPPRVFSPPALVDGSKPLRLYDVDAGTLTPSNPVEAPKLAEAAVVF